MGGATGEKEGEKARLTEFPAHPFWDYSLDVYMSEGVGAACLQLQLAHELDVNILLFCSWVGAAGRGAMTGDDMAAATGAVAAWHDEVVRALRAVRTRMKGGMPPAPDDLAESLRQRIQKVEIDCEHAEQLILAGSIPRAAADLPGDAGLSAERRAADAAQNIALYFAALGRRATDADRASLGVILGAAFRDLPASAVADACRTIDG